MDNHATASIVYESTNPSLTSGKRIAFDSKEAILCAEFVLYVIFGYDFIPTPDIFCRNYMNQICIEETGVGIRADTNHIALSKSSDYGICALYLGVITDNDTMNYINSRCGSKFNANPKLFSKLDHELTFEERYSSDYLTMRDLIKTIDLLYKKNKK